MDCNGIGTITAIIIALCALGVSIWQGFETRNNYRLSVTPKITFSSEWLIDGEFPGISMRNSGIGPAIITKIELNKENILYNVTDNPKPFVDNFGKECEKVGITRYCYNFCGTGDYLAINEVRHLIYLGDDMKKNWELVKKFNKLLSGITIKIDYQSIYGKKNNTEILTIANNFK
jgi:hypothetical protein